MKSPTKKCVFKNVLKVSTDMAILISRGERSRVRRRSNEITVAQVVKVLKFAGVRQQYYVRQTAVFILILTR